MCRWLQGKWCTPGRGALPREKCQLPPQLVNGEWVRVLLRLIQLLVVYLLPRQDCLM